MTRVAPTPEVVVDLAPHPRSGQVARGAVDSLAESLGPETMAKVRLLVTELVVAALEPADTRALRLHVRVAGGNVRAEIGAAADGEALSGPARPRRWSLFLVNRLADRWGGDGGIVWFELDGGEG